MHFKLCLVDKPKVRVVIIWLLLHQFRRHIKRSSLQRCKRKKNISTTYTQQMRCNKQCVLQCTFIDVKTRVLMLIALANLKHFNKIDVNYKFLLEPKYQQKTVTFSIQKMLSNTYPIINLFIYFEMFDL